MLIWALAILVSFTSNAYPYKRFRTAHKTRPLTIRYLVQPKSSSDKINLMFLNGYSDQMGNHKALFNQLNQAGIRVISFDYPSHGGSGGQISNWNLYETAELAGKLLKRAKLDTSLPLVLMGFSTGGTIVARILQDWRGVLPKANLAGVIFMSPAVPVKSNAGLFGFIRESDLTRGYLKFTPRPDHVFSGGNFVLSLKTQSKRALKKLLPSGIPIAVLLSDDRKDDFVKVRRTKRWIAKNAKAGRSIYAFQCSGAYHFLDVEPAGVGRKIIAMTTELARSMGSMSQFKTVATQLSKNKICPGL